ncbi:DUF2628 domain-containing protein [Methylopila sp. M107]|uniref:DUF2628 domain-containing protein n=1 Tax=Methylopila sp. M107 TaxID=1101190 RepID=UPI00036DDF2B|nr:DUF2628 domain-containing protein [Methylopila sp. M107]
MRNWLIYEPPGGARRTLDDAAKFVSVREGFSKAAFFLAPAWLASKRCWLALGLWVAAFVGAVLVIRMADVTGGGAVVLLLLPSLGVGLENAWIRARALERRGYRHVGSAMARTREEAELAFFQDWLADAPAEMAAPAAATGAYRPASSGVLGLFPQPGSAR